MSKESKGSRKRGRSKKAASRRSDGKGAQRAGKRKGEQPWQLLVLFGVSVMLLVIYAIFGPH